MSARARVQSSFVLSAQATKARLSFLVDSAVFANDFCVAQKSNYVVNFFFDHFSFLHFLSFLLFSAFVGGYCSPFIRQKTKAINFVE